MSHGGRVHKISTEAENLAKRVGKISYPDDQEQKYLTDIMGTYVELVSIGEHLLAHGIPDESHLCQVLLDGVLKHINTLENYGDLSAAEDCVAYGGFYNFGSGIVIAKGDTIWQLRAQQDSERFFQVPLEDIEAILLSKASVEKVRGAFPKYRNLLKGYGEFAFEVGLKQWDICLSDMQRCLKTQNMARFKITQEIFSELVKTIYRNTFPEA